MQLCPTSKLFCLNVSLKKIIHLTPIILLMLSFILTAVVLEILVRGESKGVIKGRDFCEALFTVWLKYPPNKEFAKGLLGK